MKNLHVLATDKPSRLFIDKNDNMLRLGKNPIVSEYSTNQNIYITNDEEIKDGDWFIDDKYKKPFKYFGEGSLLISSKKIILTDNQDLIEDGVQFIDDEFLEWFVKNPSCEYAIVDKEDWMLNPDVKFFYKIFIPSINIEEEIIIPKEELDSFEYTVNQQSYISEYINEWFENFKKK